MCRPPLISGQNNVGGHRIVADNVWYLSIESPFPSIDSPSLPTTNPQLIEAKYTISNRLPSNPLLLLLPLFHHPLRIVLGVSSNQGSQRNTAVSNNPARSSPINTQIQTFSLFIKKWKPHANPPPSHQPIPQAWRSPTNASA